MRFLYICIVNILLWVVWGLRFFLQRFKINVPFYMLYFVHSLIIWTLDMANCYGFRYYFIFTLIMIENIRYSDSRSLVSIILCFNYFFLSTLLYKKHNMKRWEVQNIKTILVLISLLLKISSVKRYFKN